VKEVCFEPEVREGVTDGERIGELSMLVKQFLKSMNIWRTYRQEVTSRPLIICKSILLQYLFFCVAADAYSQIV